MTASLHPADWLLHPRKRAPIRAACLMLVALAAGEQLLGKRGAIVRPPRLEHTIVICFS